MFSSPSEKILRMVELRKYGAVLIRHTYSDWRSCQEFCILRLGLGSVEGLALLSPMAKGGPPVSHLSEVSINIL